MTSVNKNNDLWSARISDGANKPCFSVQTSPDEENNGIHNGNNNRSPESSTSPYHSVPESGETWGVGLSPRMKRELERQLTVESSSISSSFPRRRKAMKKPDVPVTDGNAWLPHGHREKIVTVLYMSVAAVIGALFRIVLAQLFGEECRNPGTVGWLAASSPLCVTADGTDRQGGIVFADLPANLIGSFIMGLMQNGDVLDLPMSVPIAWLPSESIFQSMDVIHLAIRTGFCGSLTTFSSWNAEMVIMMFKTGINYRSQVVKSLFGYVIGMETAVGSFVFGKTVALFLHRQINPTLAWEADAFRERKEQGIFINRDLPEFERRYLPHLNMELGDCDPSMLKHLERWRKSTRDHRRIGNQMLPSLKEIEHRALVLGHEEIDDEKLCETATKHGWDIHSLEDWVRAKHAANQDHWKQYMQKEDRSFNLLIAVPMLLAIIFLLVLGLVHSNGEDAYVNTRRTMCYAGLLAPAGALLRWHLSKWNGQIPGRFSWLPAGTLAANIIGSVVSIVMIALEVRVENNGEWSFWTIATFRAVKIGFAGCLTTVSTFVAEVSSFMNLLPQGYYSYSYAFISLSLSCIISAIVYACLVFLV